MRGGGANIDRCIINLKKREQFKMKGTTSLQDIHNLRVVVPIKLTREEENPKKTKRRKRNYKCGKMDIPYT